MNDYDLDGGVLKLNPEDLHAEDEDALVDAFGQLLGEAAQ